MADRLDRHNQAYIRENARLKTQFKTQEDDRAYLIRQLVAAKKDNGRLRQELTRVKNELGDVQRQMRAGPAADVSVWRAALCHRTAHAPVRIVAELWHPRSSGYRPSVHSQSKVGSAAA